MTFSNWYRRNKEVFRLAEDNRRLRKADIKTRAELLRWVRERFPDAWNRYSFLADCTMKEATEKLWADYLRDTGK